MSSLNAASPVVPLPKKGSKTIPLWYPESHPQSVYPVIFDPIHSLYEFPALPLSCLLSLDLFPYQFSCLIYFFSTIGTLYSPHLSHTFDGHPALIQVKGSSKGNVAKCASLKDCVAIDQTDLLFLTFCPSLFSFHLSLGLIDNDYAF